MKTTGDRIEERVSAAMSAVSGQGSCAAIVRPAAEARFGDYQANGVMALAKRLKSNPRKLAGQVVEKLDVSDMCEPPEVAGPGFINLRLKPDFVATRLLEINADSQNRLGIEKESEPKTIVVDFSGPNIAKQMHVGHLRSTIIGDCICRLLKFTGHNVIPQNHIGDWGLQMGMVIYALEDADWSDDRTTGHAEGSRDFDLDILEEHYRRISQLEREDPKVAQKIRKRTAELHSGELYAKVTWRRAKDITMTECRRLYKELGVVTLTPENERGESFYAEGGMLPSVINEVMKLPEARLSDNAKCVFPEGFKNKEGEPLPLIVQKSDGAYLYATTDLAAIRYRVGQLKADRIIYVTDARQSLHFQMVFAVARMAGWDIKQKAEDRRQKTELVHVTFGSVLGENGKPLKTREGENVKLKDLLDEAVERAEAVVEQKNPELPTDSKAEIARAVGIGAVKYADYSNNRTSDYIFSFNKMLAMDGNTAPYMQYAYARIKSIERRAQTRDVDIESELAGLARLNLTAPAELDLAKQLIRYNEAIEAALADYKPNYLTGYLYGLAQKFSVFYTDCPVLAAGPDKRPTRLLLCDLTAKTIRHGLAELLGIEVAEQM